MMMNSTDENRTVDATLPQHCDQSRTHNHHHVSQHDVPPYRYTSRRISSRGRTLRRTAQLVRLEQQVADQQKTTQHSSVHNDRNTIHHPPSADVAVIPLNDDKQVNSSNEIESCNHREKMKEKRKMYGSMAMPAAMFDCKWTIDRKIQKHIDLNELPMTRPTYGNRNNDHQDIDVSILSKLKETFHSTVTSTRNDTNENVGIVDRNILLRANGWNRYAANNNSNNHDVGKTSMGDHGNFLEYEVMEESSLSASSRGLAVAVHIDSDSSCTDIPSAIQYDPNAKPFQYMTRRFFLLLYLILVVALSGIVGGCIGIISIHRNEYRTQQPSTTIDAQYSRTVHVRDVIERFITKEQLDDTTSPYGKTLHWLTLMDQYPFTLDTTTTPLLSQRYFVAYLYFATSTHQQPWTTGCAPTNNHTDLIHSINNTHNNRCQYIVTTNQMDDNELKEAQSFFATRWLSESDVCEWAGIQCDGAHHVRSIDLSKYAFVVVFFWFRRNIMWIHSIANGPTNSIIVGSFYRFCYVLWNRWIWFDRSISRGDCTFPIRRRNSYGLR
jgi:hypothetical protein